MEYGRLEPIEGKNGYEKTALTMMTISELLAQEGTTMEEVMKMRDAAAAAAAPVNSGLQQPPHMHANTQDAENTGHRPPVQPPVSPVVAAPAETKAVRKPRSFLTSLLGQ